MRIRMILLLIESSPKISIRHRWPRVVQKKVRSGPGTGNCDQAHLEKNRVR